MDIQFARKLNPYPHWEYSNKKTGNLIRIVPERGGLITEWRSGGNEVIYFDRERFIKTNLSVRGGIPILFPICGDMPQNSLDQTTYQINQHGFARDNSWSIDLLQDESGICLSMSNNDKTNSIFPYSFLLEIEVRLVSSSLEIAINVNNRSKQVMPFCFGLHPYFNVSNLDKIHLEGLPSKCINQKNMSESETSLQVASLSQGVDILAEYCKPVIMTDLLTGHSIKLKHSFPMDLTVIWTDPPRSMICLEPWTSPRGSLASGQRKLEVQPDSIYRLFTCFEYN